MKFSEQRKRSRQARATHRRRRADIAAKYPQPPQRESWIVEERRKRLMRDPWRAAAFALLPGGLFALRENAGLAALKGSGNG